MLLYKVYGICTDSSSEIYSIIATCTEKRSIRQIQKAENWRKGRKNIRQNAQNNKSSSKKIVAFV